MISDALKGTNFDAKMDVVLPLLGVSISERLRNTAIQCKSIRNLVVHNKASPNLMALTGDRKSDEKIAEERAAGFFSENPVERIEQDIETFFDNGIYSSEAVQTATVLFDKYCG